MRTNAIRPLSESTFKVGDRVWYKDEDEGDAGTVVELLLFNSSGRKEELIYRVRWDDGSQQEEGDDVFTCGQLGRLEQSP
jgi:hypothetical protein